MRLPVSGCIDWVGVESGSLIQYGGVISFGIDGFIINLRIPRCVSARSKSGGMQKKNSNGGIGECASS